MNTSKTTSAIGKGYRGSMQAMRCALLATGLLLGGWTAQAAAPDQQAATTSPLPKAFAPRPDGLALSAGQGATPLPDGRWLLSGGALARSTASAQLLIFDPATRKTTPLSSRLQMVRSAHSATLLPSGSVLIHGGINDRGLPVDQSEVVDPLSGQSRLLGASGLLARSHHSATVLSDGRVLITGGVNQRGLPLLDAELFNPVTAQAERFNARLHAPRLDGAAAMLPNGHVLVSGGVDTAGQPVLTSEAFDPQTQDFRDIPPDTAQDLARQLLTPSQAPRVVTSLPAADGVDTPVDTSLMVRFSSRLNVTTLSGATVTLIGPNGNTPVQVVPVERGVLLFVTPTEQLLPASPYTLFIKGARDAANRPLPLFALGFKTETLRSGSSKTATGAALQPGARDPARSAADDAADLAKNAALQAAAIDEEWVPTASHRRGEWMSHRAYLAHQSLPQRNDLHQLIQSRTPKTPDPLAAVVAQAVSEQTVRRPQPSWAQVDSQARALSAALKDEGATASPGGTALAGHVLRLNGRPLANVTLQIGNVRTHTDAQGEFLLSGVPAGNQVLVIDARTANRPGATYGRFEYIYHLVPGKTNLLPFTVWMPKLDTRHAVHIDSPTQRDTVISNPSMPGLEIVLPAGTVVRDADGKIVTEVTLTPLPVDQPPYPMPYAGVPLHYTLQPGGAVIQGVDGKPRGAIVHYPNYTSFGPGTPVHLFDYDAKGRGWYVYASAQVSSNGAGITSDRDFLIYQFGTTSYSAGGPTPPPSVPPSCSPPPPGSPPPAGGWGEAGGAGSGTPGSACGGDPVDLQNGSFRHIERDLFLDDVIPIDITRTYRSGGGNDGTPLVKAFGTDMSGPYEAYLYFDPGFKQIQMVMADGSRVNFDNANGVGAVSYDTLPYQNTSDAGGYRGAYIQQHTSEGTFVVTFRDGRHWAFSQYSARLIWIEDRLGNRMTFTRPNVNAYISRVTSPNGRTLDIAYNASGLIGSITDNLGRQFSYAYAAGSSNLQTVTDPNGKTRQYQWTGDNRLSQVTDPNGNVMVQNTYEVVHMLKTECGSSTSPTPYDFATGRILSQQLADGSRFSYGYSTVPYWTGCPVKPALNPSQITQVTDRRGTIRKVEMDANGNVTRNTAALGLPEEQVTTFAYTNNLLTSRTDPLGRQTTYQYDAAGNLTKTTRLAGTAGAVSVSATYDTVFNQPLTLTDANGHTTALSYDSLGNLIIVKDALGHATALSYTSQGQLSAITDPLGHKTSFTYSGADLASVTDPLNRKTQYLTDAAGRVMTTIDPLGNRTYQSWDSLNRLTRITDALGGLTQFGYDANGNVLTQTDASNHSTSFSYNAIGRVQGMKDALLNSESRVYEAGGLLKQRTDRQGQVSGVTYDALGRVATIGFGATAASPTAYTGTATLSWDKGNRLTKIVDVQAGRTTSITRSYDGLDRLTQEVTEQGQIDFTYDNAGRRTSMTVKNGPSGAQVAQPRVSYSWDNADRLTQITQAAGASNNNVAQTVGFTYDNASRTTKVTYTGGQSINTTYTDAGEVASITYKKPDGTTIASGTYTYDAAGRRTGVTGDLATFVQASGTDVTDASYNAANQLTRWGGKAFAYDRNGNLTSDGVSSYQWDARGQLAGITGGATASFQYDVQRRRIAKTLGGTTTAFNYDGDNFVQELSGTGTSGTVRANLLTGGVDQLFMRSVSGTTPTLSWVLPEANNHAIILTDSTGATKQTYAYEPYGRTTPSGADTNSQQYTGRENDGTGLYFYRNRYYMPGCMRFISEDPIGWASGQTNNYAYVGGDPVSWIDQSGLFGAADLPSIPAPAMDFLTGMADSASLGIGPLVRGAMGVDGGVNSCSSAYSAGQWASLAFGVGRMAYAGIAAGGARMAANGAAAMTFRNSLKRVMRGPLAVSNYRIKSYSDLMKKYGSDEAVQAAAGRTNSAVNAVGADMALGAAVGTASSGGCD